MAWISEYSSRASKTDRFAGNPDHIQLLAAGLFGEAGSLLTELKKQKREEGGSYPKEPLRLKEDIGDFLWYFFRLVDLLQPKLVQEFDSSLGNIPIDTGNRYSKSLHLGAAVGKLMDALEAKPLLPADLNFESIWKLLRQTAKEIDVSLEVAAKENLQKIFDRWPETEDYHDLFDNGFEEEERLPRQLEIEFREKIRGKAGSVKPVVILRCNGVNFGDPLTDNNGDLDGYRYHDIFHFSYMVFLGWSPVIRALMKCKRKSDPSVDEAEDGARAVIVEEAVSAAVFSRIKTLGPNEKLEHIDFDLLKMIKEFVKGYQVERVPLWQWEKAIIQGHNLFRKLCENNGGRLILNMHTKTLDYLPIDNGIPQP